MRESKSRQISVRVKKDEKAAAISAKSGELCSISIEPASITVRLIGHDSTQPGENIIVHLSGHAMDYHQALDEDGAALFNYIKPGTYSIDVTIEGIESEYYESQKISDVFVASREEKTVDIQVEILATLEVKVIYADTGKLVGGVEVNAQRSETSTQKRQSKDEPAVFAGIIPGQYDINALLPEEIAQSHFISGSTSISLPAGKKTEVIIEAQKCMRVLFWNINELGGGFFWPEVRSSLYIDAYATIISRMEADICVIAGLRQYGSPGFEQQRMKDGSVCFAPAKRVEDSGAKEVERIVNALGQMDSSITWKIGYLAAEDDKAIAYQAGTTTCVIYRDHENLILQAAELVIGPGDGRIGLPVELLCVLFGVPGAREGFVNEMVIAAPLTILKDVLRAKVFIAGDPDRRLRPEKDLPVSCLAALSTSRDISEISEDVAERFRADPLTDPETFGRLTEPDCPYWEAVSQSSESILDNPIIAAIDPSLQDQMMHWEAMDLPSHPADPDKVKGSLSDLILVRSGASGNAIDVREIRAIDMVRACLEGGKPPSDKSSQDSSQKSDQPLPEDGILAELCRKYAEGFSDQSSSEKKDDAVTAVNKSVQFSRCLSDHWPLLVSAAVSNLKKLPKE